MNSFGTEVAEASTNEKPQETADQDPKPNIPLRQRRLPASFWQEPCPSQSPSNRDITHSPIIQSPLQQFPLASMHPWTVNSATLPLFAPQRLIPPSHYLLPHTTTTNNNLQWIRGSSNCCACATCLSYPYAIPRLPDLYNGLQYRPAINVPTTCCPVLNCTDQNCKLCSASSERWHPDRLRHFRLRAARYNAILD